MFWVKNIKFFTNWLQVFSVPYMFKIKIIYIWYNLWLKKERFPPSSFLLLFDPGSGIRYGNKIRIRDKHPGSATLVPTLSNLFEPFSVPNLTHSTCLQHNACLPAFPKMYLNPCLFQVKKYVQPFLRFFSAPTKRYNLLQPILTTPNLVNRGSGLFQLF
jgi:hypothetical protein